MQRRSECRYCGANSHGYGCSFSDDGLHKEVGDSEHCIMCGSSSYGTGCSYPSRDNKNRVHIHGHGDRKCVYCGRVATGTGCPYSPNGKHQM